METLASDTSPEEQLRAENAVLRARLAEAEEALRAIRSGRDGSFVVETEDRPQTFSLDAAGAGSNRLRGEIIDQVSDAVGMIDNDDRITYLNPACERLYRVQPGEMLGRKLSELYQRRWLKPGDEAAAIATLREQGEASWELIHVCRDGRELYVHSSVCLTHDASGKVTGIIAAIRDITERMAMEEKLRERENFLQRLTDVSPGVIHVFDLEQKRSVFISRTVASVIGYSEEEIAAMGDNAATLLMHPDELARFPAHLERVRLLDDHETIDFEHRMRSRTGEWHWFHSRDAVFARDAAGAVRQLIGTAIEITARKQIEERFRQTLMNVSVPTLLYADDGTILLVNQAWTDITGYRIEDIPTLGDWTRKAYGEQHLTADNYIEDLFKHDTRQDDGEWIVTTARGDKRVWHFSSTPLGREPSGRRLIVSNAIDITDRKRAEVAMVESKQKLDVAMQVGGIGAWSLDVNTQTLRNDALLKNLFGFGADDSPPLDEYFNRIHPNDRIRISQAVADAIENNTIYDQEYRIDLPDGGVRWARSYAQNFSSAEGSVKEFTGITYDVTDRKLRELDLADRESHLRRVIDNMLGFVGVLNTDGTLLEVNQTALAAGGVSRDDVIGQKFWDCIWWNYDPDVIKHLQDSVERASSGKTVRYDVDIRITGDARLTVDFMLVPVRDQDGSITHLIPSGVDITDRKAAEAAVAESQRKLQLGIDVAAFSLAEVDYVTQTIELSSDAARLFGLENTPTVVPRQRIHDLFHPEDRSRINAAIEDCLDPGALTKSRWNTESSCPMARLGGWTFVNAFTSTVQRHRGSRCAVRW